MSNNNKGYNISLQATAKMGGALITTAKGNRATTAASGWQHGRRKGWSSLH